MTKQEVFLKTLLCCMACDGNIDQEELDLVKKITNSSPLFEGLSTDEKLTEYASNLQASPKEFVSAYVNSLLESNLSSDDELNIAKLAIQAIEANNVVEYSEIQFFKKIRQQLRLSDSALMDAMPDKEDYWLPDASIKEYSFDTLENLSEITFDLKTQA